MKAFMFVVVLLVVVTSAIVLEKLGRELLDVLRSIPR